MKIVRKIKMINNWIKLLGQRISLEFKVHNMLKNECDRSDTRVNSWAGHVRKELQQCGLSEIWVNQLLIDIPSNLIKQRITDQYKQLCYSIINISSRLTTYSSFKSDFSFEPYLQALSNPRFLMALTKFRVSAHYLAIETGQHTGTERSMRKCVLCNINVVESEFHFMLVCPFYSELRNQYLPRYYNHWPTLQKFEDLISKQSKHVIQQISWYIHYAFQKRTNLLN